MSKVERFKKIVNGFYPLAIFTKVCILDVWQGSEYVSFMRYKICLYPREFRLRFTGNGVVC